MILSVVAGRTGIRKFAGTLNEMKSVIIAPCLDVILPDIVQRTDQLHSLKVRTVELWHHRLDLCPVQHSH